MAALNQQLVVTTKHVSETSVYLTDALTNVKHFFEVGITHMIIQCFNPAGNGSILSTGWDLIQDRPQRLQDLSIDLTGAGNEARWKLWETFPHMATNVEKTDTMQNGDAEG